MKRHKKILFAVLLVTVVLAGSIGGAVLASDDEEKSSTTPEFGNFIERVLEIYQEKTDTIINKESLQESLSQAREEMREEQPYLHFHHKIFDDDELTEEQQEEIEAWLEAKPEFPTDEFRKWLESRPQLSFEEFNEWLESMPEDMPFDFGMRSRFGPRVFGNLDKAGDRFHMFGCFGSEKND